jgi:hypothetical protein
VEQQIPRFARNDNYRFALLFSRLLRTLNRKSGGEPPHS